MPRVKSTNKESAPETKQPDLNSPLFTKVYKYRVRYDFTEEAVTYFPGTNRSFKNSMLDLEFDTLEEAKNFDISNYSTERAVVDLSETSSYSRIIKIFNPHSLVFDIVDKKKIKVK